jgi:SAM-dependent methyltransferase
MLPKLLGATATREKIVKRFIQPDAGMDLLDAGCGTAKILKHLPKGLRYVGFDASAGYIAHARQQFGSCGDFKQSLVTKKTLESSRNYDLVLASGLLHHFEDEKIVVFVATAKRAPRPTGRLITID